MQSLDLSLRFIIIYYITFIHIMDKSNIVVFRKEGYLCSGVKWVYGGSTASVVISYKYLGINFSTKLSFKRTCDD